MIRLFALLLFAAPLYGVDPPGLTVATTEPQASQPTGTIKVESGRFVPLNDVSGKPTLLLGNEAGLLTIYPIKAGEAVFGIRYDEPPGTKTKRYTFPTGATQIAVAGDTGGIASLVAVNNGKALTDPPVVAGQLTIEVTGARPPPDPIPNPTPTPVKGKLFSYIVVEETGTTWSDRGATIATAAAWADANDIKRRWVDQDVKDVTGNPPKDMVPWLNRAKGKKLPMVYLVTAKGEILFEGELPLSSDGFLALLKKYKEAQ